MKSGRGCAAADRFKISEITGFLQAIATHLSERSNHRRCIANSQSLKSLSYSFSSLLNIFLGVIVATEPTGEISFRHVYRDSHS